MANPNGNPQNLKTPSTTEDAKAKGRKGGIASGRSRRKWKEFRKLFEIALTRKQEGKDSTAAEDIVLAMIEKALKGDVQAFKEIRDTMGEKPTDKQELSGKNGEGIQVVCFDGGPRIPV